MDEFVEWVQEREYSDEQIQFRREVAARDPVTRSCEMDVRVREQLADRGIDELYAHQTDAIEAIRNGSEVPVGTVQSFRDS